MPVNPQSSEPLALSPDAAAGYAGLSKRQLYRLLADGTITARQTKGRTLIDGDSLRAYYRSLSAFKSGASLPNAPQMKAPTKRRASSKVVRS